MTREEKIFIESNKYAIEMHDAYPSIDIDDYAFDFRVGAQWADENPQSPWISVTEDLPCNHKEMIINADSLNPTTKKVLIYNKNKEIRVSWMLYRKDKGWVWDITAYSTPLFFMFIPEPTKE